MNEDTAQKPNADLAGRANNDLLVRVNHPGWDNQKDANEMITKSAITFCEALAPVVKRAAKAMNEIGNAMYKTAEKEYSKHHTKLPGGTSNTRLRKKRRTVVMKWFWENTAHNV